MGTTYITFTTKEKERIEFPDDTVNDDFKLEIGVDVGHVAQAFGYLDEQQMRSLRDWLTKQLGE